MRNRVSGEVASSGVRAVSWRWVVRGDVRSAGTDQIRLPCGLDLLPPTCDLAGTGLQALALLFGPLSLVQPIMVSGMFLAIPLEAALDRRLPHARDLLAVGTGAAGLAAFLVVAQPRPGVTDPSRHAWIAVLASCAVTVAACVLVARVCPETLRGTVPGVATGVVDGLTAALLKVGITGFTENPAGVFTEWHLDNRDSAGGGGRCRPGHGAGDLACEHHPSQR